MFVCCLCVFLFFLCFSLKIRESAAAADLNCSTHNTKTPGSPSRWLMLVMVSSVASDIFEWNNNHTRIRTVLSFTCLKKTRCVCRLLLGSSPLPGPRGVFFCTFPQRTGRESFVPRNVFTQACPRTRQHTHSCTHTHARQQCTSPSIPLCRRSRRHLSDTLPPLRLVEARLAQVFSGKKKKKINKQKTNKQQNKTKMLDVFFLSSFCFFKSKQFNLEICLGLKRRSMLKFPLSRSLFFFCLASSINTVWPLGEKQKRVGGRDLGV